MVLGPADLHQPPSTFWSVTLQPLVGYQPTMHHMKADMYSFHMRHMSVIYYLRLLLSVIGLVSHHMLSPVSKYPYGVLLDSSCDALTDYMTTLHAISP